MNQLIYVNKSKLDIIKGSIIFKEPSILYDKSNKKIEHLIEKLEILNPLNALKRGYSVTKLNNKAIDSVKNIKKDDILDILLKDGTIKANVMEVNNG